MRSKGLGALVLSAVMIGLAAARIGARRQADGDDGRRRRTSRSRARGSTASVDPNKQATTYFFQYGTTIALGAQTAPTGGRRR